jgi:hypothetical protein
MEYDTRTRIRFPAKGSKVTIEGMPEGVEEAKEILLNLSASIAAYDRRSAETAKAEAGEVEEGEINEEDSSAADDTV